MICGEKSVAPFKESLLCENIEKLSVLRRACHKR